MPVVICPWFAGLNQLYSERSWVLSVLPQVEGGADGLRCPPILPSLAAACTAVTYVVWTRPGEVRGVCPACQDRGRRQWGSARYHMQLWEESQRFTCLLAGKVGNEKRAAVHSWFHRSEITTVNCEKHIHRGVSACETKWDFTVLKHTFFSNMLERCSQYVTFH